MHPFFGYLCLASGVYFVVSGVLLMRSVFSSCKDGERHFLVSASFAFSAVLLFGLLFVADTFADFSPTVSENRSRSCSVVTVPRKGGGSPFSIYRCR